MKVLLFSSTLNGSAIFHKLVKEGHEVKLHVQSTSHKKYLDGIIPKTKDWKNELSWVGRNGLVVFDDVGFGTLQSLLRKKGYTVFGSSVESDALTLDKAFERNFVRRCGIDSIPSYNFTNLEYAENFVSQNRAEWVVKAPISYLSESEYVTESQYANVSTTLRHLHDRNIKSVQLQQKIHGVEVGISRVFNGHDWVGPIKLEHGGSLHRVHQLQKNMASVLWHSKEDALPLFERTLKKLTLSLRTLHFRGDLHMRCVVDQNNIWNMRVAPRLDPSTMQLYSALNTSSLAEFMFESAKGEAADLFIGNNFMVTAPVYHSSTLEKTSGDTDLHVLDEATYRENKDWIHLKEAAVHEGVVQSPGNGYVADITASASDISHARLTILNNAPILKRVASDLYSQLNSLNTVTTFEMPLLKAWSWI